MYYTIPRRKRQGVYRIISFSLAPAGHIGPSRFMPSERGVSVVEKKTVSKPAKKRTAAPEMAVTVHHAAGGPSLEACMISILSRYMSKSED